MQLAVPRLRTECLIRRLGRPIVVARGSEADGDILTERPTP